MKLSISNIAWSAKHDRQMTDYIKELGWSGLEIAPTRIFPNCPYNRLDEAGAWAAKLKDEGIEVSSMQSIWYGHTEKIFSGKKERTILIDYTRKAILFAEAIGCGNLVFGNPKNRDTEDMKKDLPVAIDFFREIGDFAAAHHTVIALEPNPIIYNTRFMNRTEQAVEMAYKVNSKGIRVNVDLGAMIYNEESIGYLKQIAEFINHIHISEPGLVPIVHRELHKELFTLLRWMNYDKYVSIEMGKQNDMEAVKKVMDYVNNIRQ